MHLKRHSWALSGEILSFCHGLFSCLFSRSTDRWTDRQTVEVDAACEDPSCHVSSVRGHDVPQDHKLFMNGQWETNEQSWPFPQSQVSSM